MTKNKLTFLVVLNLAISVLMIISGPHHTGAFEEYPILNTISCNGVMAMVSTGPALVPMTVTGFLAIGFLQPPQYQALGQAALRVIRVNGEADWWGSVTTYGPPVHVPVTFGSAKTLAVGDRVELRGECLAPAPSTGFFALYLYVQP